MPSTGRKGGLSRSVKASGNHGPYSRTAVPETRTMGAKALEKAWQEGQQRLQQEMSGLGEQSINAIRDMQGANASQLSAHDDMLTVNDGNSMDWEDVPLPEQPQDDHDTFAYAARDLMDERYRGHAYRDGRTWRQQTERLQANWAPRIDEMLDAYLIWKYTSSSDSQHVPTSTPASTPGMPRDIPEPVADPLSYDFTIEVLDLYTLKPFAEILRSEDSKSVAEALMMQGYIGSTPENPSLALSVQTLQLFRQIRLCKPSFSVEAFARVLCDLYNVPYRRRYRSALSNAFDIYLTLIRKVDAQVAEALERTGPNWRVLNACPACSYELSNEPPLIFKRMFAMDANFSLKRMSSGSKNEGDVRTFTESDYYLTFEEVDKYADEVKSSKSRQMPMPVPALAHGEGDEEDADDMADEGLPTAAANKSGCAVRWKAAASDEKKKMWAIFLESGMFASACRHGMILWIADLIRSGELAKFPLAIIAKALQVFDGGWVMGYDIGCAFTQTIKSSSLGPEFEAQKCRCCVNAFHGYSHSYDCQKQHHPNAIEGMGLEDLEILERIFSSSNQLGGLTRYMTRYRRRVFIDQFFRNWDNDKYANLGIMLHNNYVQALRIIDEELPALEHAKETLNISEGSLEQWHIEEVEYFRNLGNEPEHDVHRTAYVEALQTYREICAKYETASQQFILTVPAEASTSTYSQELSQTRRAETSRRYLAEKRDQILLEITSLELALNIDVRWTPAMKEYQEALEYTATRDYHKALDKLQKLVVQHLFELHKLNLNFTGYKMRTHIAKALQARCKAIRNAVNMYNAAAVKLSPPKPTLDWSRVSHYSFLEEFDLLRGSHQDIAHKRWTELAVRETMKQDLRIKRAREEISRCNVEIRRVHTSILDEQDRFEHRLRALKAEGSPLYGPTLEFVELRQRVNNQILAQLEQTYKLPGFTGDQTRGIRNGAMDTSSADQFPPSSPSAQRERDLDDTVEEDYEDGGDGENHDGDIGGLVDYISELPVRDIAA